MLQHGDIETNPGPQKEKTKNLSCCHWNVNSLIAHNLSELAQLEAYNSVYKHDFICISEMFFDPSIQEGDKNIQLGGYNLLRADHPSNSKRGGVCIFYKETLGIRIVKSLSFKVLINALFVKSLYKIARVMLALYIGLQAKIFLNSKIFCQNLRKF